MPNQHTVTTIDPALKQWATPAQAAYIDAINDAGGMRAAARRLGRAVSALSEAVAAVRVKAAAHNYAPDQNNSMVHPWPVPMISRGNSVLRDGDGNIKLVWEKSKLDDQRWLEAQMQVVAALAADLPRMPPIPFKRVAVDESLCTVYTLTDSHVGMLAWGRETGVDLDLKIAESTLCGCVRELVRAAPASKVGFLNQLGDFLHQDGLQAVTPTSGHNLDADGRFEKIIEVAVRVLRRAITMMLDKHEKVVVLLAEGNHDIVSSIWLRKLFAALYENEPRVQVIDSALPYYSYQHGKTMLGFHHGHLKKNDALPLLMASQFPKVWGETEYRYVHVGHNHHTDIKEHQGMTVHQHPTLAARDAYAARYGYFATRSVTAVTYSDRFGQAGSVTVVPEMLTA